MATTTRLEKAGSPHVAIVPSAGMGHLNPYLELTAMLHARGCAITMITAKPTVSKAESDSLSNFFTIYPQIKHIDFQLVPYKKSKFINNDPFFIQFESICNSVHLLQPILSSLAPSLSAIVADFAILRGVSQLASDLSIPIYTLIITTARFFSLMAYLPQLLAEENKAKLDAARGCGFVDVPALGPIPVASIPPQMLDPNHYFAGNIISNATSLSKAKGVLINAFTSLEPEAIEALKRNGVEHILPVGPLEPFEAGKAEDLPWLDEQAPESVLYISYGNRTAMAKDQMRELGAALEKAGFAFLWMLKGSKVDREDKEEVEDLLGASFVERTKKQGMVIKGWVNQQQVLAHPAIGGFLSHAGSNSVLEAAKLGVPMLAWPPGGDQHVNAEVAEKAGLGLWMKEWGWSRERVIDRNEIAEKLIELMQNKDLRAKAKEVKEKARRAREADGTSETLLRGLIDSLEIKEN